MCPKNQLAALAYYHPNAILLSPSGNSAFLVSKGGRGITLTLDEDGALKGYEFMGCLLRVLKEHGYDINIRMRADSTVVTAEVHHVNATVELLFAQGKCLVDATVSLFLLASMQGLVHMERAR